MPAILGRTHTNDNEHFFGLGKVKAVSRHHCVIDFRDDQGGKVICKKGTKDQMEYEQADTSKPIPEIICGDGQQIPPKGFFTVECLGKNAILVGGKRVEKGQVAILESGTPMRISSYLLYFLSPLNAHPRKTIQVIDANKKKRKEIPPISSPQQSPSLKKVKAAPFSGLQAELDSLTVKTLLERMNEAVKSHVWERKHQLIGATIAVHAVKDATASTLIQNIFIQDGGVSRGEIMQWIRDSHTYMVWVDQMLSRMEAKSYQNTVTKALLKLGHVRTGSGGRYIKWILSDKVQALKKETFKVSNLKDISSVNGIMKKSNGNDNDDPESSEGGQGCQENQDDNDSEEESKGQESSDDSDSSDDDDKSDDRSS